MARREVTTPSLFALGPREEALVRRGSFARVALNRPVRREFTYAVPAELRARAAVGARVAVPFGARRSVGVIVELEEETLVPEARTKSVAAVLDDQAVVGPELLGLTRWISERYACSWGEALAAVLPAPLKRERLRRRVPRVRLRPGVTLAELESLRARHPEQHRLLRTLMELGGEVMLREILRSLRLSESPARSLARRGWIEIELVAERSDPLATSSAARPRPAALSAAQARALERIRASLDARRAATFLLHGVTGSGKTEVYLQAIEHARTQGRAAIVLVPEIALTPQTVGWFRARFGGVCVLHSRMSDGQRLAEWRRLQSGQARVVVGARSAVFAPLEDVGVIVVDEEHEPSFKQESVPRYHAREVAVERARRAGAVCLLGSATPALETWHAAATGSSELLALPERVGGGAPCSVQVVDMRRGSERARGTTLFSRVLLHHLAEALGRGEQAILFLNRRGFVPVFHCPGCGSTVGCGRCSTALTYHRRIQRLVCHTCCKERDLPAACPTCSRPGLRQIGGGSEKVEVELARALPAARAARMDSDTMRRREDYERTLAAFERHELDVLVGTQMIAKGLDFPGVTVVGVLSADQALRLPEFRAEERAFQLIAQVAGRAGRGARPGRVIVQSSMPEHPSIVLGARADFAAMARYLERTREPLGYPPFGRLCRVVFEDSDAERGLACARRWADGIRARFPDGRVRLEGPGPAPLAQLRGKHRCHLLVQARADEARFAEVVAWLADARPDHAATDARIDVDPMNML